MPTSPKLVRKASHMNKEYIYPSCLDRQHAHVMLPSVPTNRYQALYNAASMKLSVPEGCFIVFWGASIGFASHKTTALKAGNCRCSISRFTT